MQHYLEKIEELIDNFKRYSVTSVDLIKLETVDRLSTILSNLISKAIIGLIVTLFLFFFSLGICFYLSELFNNNYLGFGLVAGFYLLLAIVLLAGYKKFLARPIREKIIHEIFHSKTTN
jgi:hypothetical protein